MKIAVNVIAKKGIFHEASSKFWYYMDMIDGILSYNGECEIQKM